MTPRRPPGLSYQSWVDQQVREAQARGAFDGLAGAGRPIADIDRPQGELEWIAKMLRRENVDPSVLLPLSLTLRKERQDLHAVLAGEADETAVRAHVADLNSRIREAHRRPQEGPPLTVMSVDVEQVVARWREDRAALQAAYEQARAQARAADEARRQALPVPWWRRRLQRGRRLST